MEETKSVYGTRGISGSTLKIIAIITMLIDHTAAVIVLFGPWMSNPELAKSAKNIYYIMRYIGRIAFPIFCFLLVEGFIHTSNIKNYAKRLFIFSLISEIPFDLAIYKRVGFEHQNVFFTLFIGLMVIWGIKYIGEKYEGSSKRKLYEILTVLIGVFIAEILKTDYSGFGVFFIVIMYYFHNNIMLRNIIGAIAISWELTAPIAFIPITFYNGKRGLSLKYVFYLFYPVHLFVLYLIAGIIS